MNFIPISEDEVRELNRLVVPPEPARAGWVIDIEATKKALDLFQIKLPVHIRLMKGYYRYGTHYARYGWHRITLNQDHPIDHANHTLLHELTHCQQAEQWAARTGRPSHNFYREEYRYHGTSGAAYINNPYEVHAREQADRYAPTLKLLREVT